MKLGLAAHEFTERDQHIFTAFQFLDRHIKRVGSRQSATVYRPQNELMTMFQLTTTTGTIYLFPHPQQGGQYQCIMCDSY